jgi:hypothetical protein
MMNLEPTQNLQFLNEKQYWMYGPCFEVRFYFQEKRCAPTDFERGLLSDSMVSAPPRLSVPMSDMPGRCVLATGNGEDPLGFIYFGGDRGDYDYYYIATYPLQIERHCGEFHWNGNADNPQSVIDFYAELIPFVRRLHSKLKFHLAFISDEGAPWFTPPRTSLTGILIYDWLAQQGEFGSSEFIGYCYARLPFD